MKPKISIIYSLARSGATLISRCIGCAEGNVILSEINPRFSWFNPLVQAWEWYGLLTSDEITALKSNAGLRYIDAIRLISEKCQERDLNLVIRDWTHIDFTPGDYPVEPIYQLSQDLVLQEHFDIRRVAITRHPLDAYLSVCQVPRMQGTLSTNDYMAGFLKFSEIAKSIGFIRYEDFCEHPKPVLGGICDTLDISYADDFESRYNSFTRVTGEIYNARDNETVTGEAIGTRSQVSIKPPPRRAVPTRIGEELLANADYPMILDLLGYNGQRK